jgi:PKD repeat protein
MKKFYVLLSFLLLGVGVNAQITCNASFSSNQSSSNTGMVNFINNSTASIFNHNVYTWDFGDGQSGVSSSWNGNISHTYVTAGTYYVRLKMEVLDSVTSNVLCTSYVYDTVSISSITTVTAHCTAIQTSSGSATINFQGSGNKNSSVPSYSTYIWNFGDGNGSTSQNPTHTYAITGGYYTVTFTHQVRDSITNSILASASFTRWIRPGSIDSCEVTISKYVYHNQRRVHFNAYGKSASYTGIRYPKSILWDFGDGNSSTQGNVSHTYSQDGVYNVTCYMTSYDSINQTMFCLDTAFTSVTVAYKVPPVCNASYYVDTASSGNGNLVIYNNSAPAINNPNYTISYRWSFGDGDSSNLPFPSHTYANPGAYVVCLGMFVTDTNNQTCSDYFCDTIGIDSLGNVIYKNASTGFTLNVLDPATISQKEYELAEVSLYPNPASDYITLEGLPKETRWSLISITGSKVAEGYLGAGKKALSISNVPDGLYILNLEGAKNLKVQVKH